MPTLPPKALFHWSQEPLTVFLTNAPRFEVHTQGRAWVIDKISTKKGATWRVTATSLAVFREQAAGLFVRHPLLSWLGWKRIFGQWWSKDLCQDLVWDASDAFQCGRVMVVRRARFADINDPVRLAEQKTKRRRIVAGELAGIPLLVLLVTLAALVNGVFTERINAWLFSLLPDVEESTAQTIRATGIWIAAAAISALAISIYLMKIVRQPDSDGSKWDVAAELKCAMEKADKAQAAEQRRNSSGR